MVGESAAFAERVLKYVTGKRRERALDDLQRYEQRFTGAAFESLADADPNRITGNDIVAVSMLSVDIPAVTSRWLLGEGAAATAELLRQIPTVEIADLRADLGPESPAMALWKLLSAQPGLGRTKTSKLLAAKRPALIPVYDKVVGKALKIGKRDNDWEWWSQALATGTELRAATEALRAEAGGRHSLLRTLDIVVWMAERD